MACSSLRGLRANIGGPCRASDGWIVDGTCRPQLLRDGQGRNLQICPPRPLVTLPVQLVVMSAAKRHNELVADLAAQGSGLGEFEVVRIGRPLLADQTGLAAHKQPVDLAALARRLLGMGERCLVRWQRWLGAFLVAGGVGLLAF